MRAGALVLLLVCAASSCRSSGAKGRAPAPRAALDGVWSACRTRNAKAIWEVSTEELKREVDARASKFAQALSAEDLSRGFPPFRGKNVDFTGRAYLGALLATDDPAKNPCFGAAEWQLTGAESEPPRHVFVMERPDGHDITLSFLLRSGSWQFTGFGKPTKREPTAPRSACSWDGHYRFDVEWQRSTLCDVGELPRRIDVHVRPGKDGRPSFLPQGRQPTDVYGAPSCELEFDGPRSGLPEGRRLKLEFEERGSTMVASGKYSMMEKSGPGAAAGCSVVLTVKASRVPPR